MEDQLSGRGDHKHPCEEGWYAGRFLEGPLQPRSTAVVTDCWVDDSWQNKGELDNARGEARKVNKQASTDD